MQLLLHTTCRERGKSRHSDNSERKKQELIKGCLGHLRFFLDIFCKHLSSAFNMKFLKAIIKCNCFISNKPKGCQRKNGNPPALTLGTTILLTLCNFLIAEDINMIIKIEVVAHVLLTSVICSLLPVCAQEN